LARHDFDSGGCWNLVYTKKKKEKQMKYEKPEVVAKSESKESFVADCPQEKVMATYCYSDNASCMCGPLN